jgi:anaerobic sulfite reductase subunit B
MNGASSRPFRLETRQTPAPDVVTLTLRPVDEPLPLFRPGQVALLGRPGAPMMASAISGQSDTGGLQFTVRAVDAAGRALSETSIGTVVEVSGPFGHGWPVPAPTGADLILVAGDLGVAPLRPLIQHVAADRRRYRRVSLFIGARWRHDLLFTDEYRAWMDAGIGVLVAVDRRATGAPGWIASVAALFDQAGDHPADTTGYLCGPPMLLRSATRRLVEHGVPGDRIWLSPAQCPRLGVDPIVRSDLAAEVVTAGGR